MIVKTASRLESVKAYYFSKKIEQIAKMRSAGHEVFMLGIGNPDLPPPKVAIEKLTESAEQNNSHGYQSYRGVPALRVAMAEWMEQIYEVKLDFKTEILPLMGSKEGITHVSLAFLNPGDEVLIPDLGYPAYASVSKIVGAKIVKYPLDPATDWAPDWAFLKAYPAGRAKLLWLNYPHMPTGRPGNSELFSKFVRLAKTKQFLLCHDNPYSLVLNPKPFSILNIAGAKEVAVELNSMSKTYNMAGWRVGWLSGQADYLDAVFRIKSNFDSGMFSSIQQGAIAALQTPPAWREGNNNIYKERKKYAVEICKRLGCEVQASQTGMFVWSKMPDHYSDSYDFVDLLLQNYHIFVTPGNIFGESGKRYIRISLCNDIAVLKKTLERLKDFKISD